ncbi:MAG: GNAT family N-acetyltransferase [candidate division KSB1 bacterium]|nr:GNAT family N-acetyltransferase [candidate division KSB1 bacterium]MDZ7303780.1 GNAT family N-acetyltransferase [candidate division KSB1 bacterium]MDZ7313039.1 GNAT family N-acetyltransferase [candidate division KSB1 bacterium]
MKKQQASSTQSKRNVCTGMSGQPAFSFHPLTPERWHDLETLFGERGACGGCWCMWWRLRRSQFNRQKGPGNKKAFKSIVSAGEIPGILVYAGDQPVGWCAIAPRDTYPVLNKSRILRPVDNQPVWSVTCFFVAREFRGHGISVGLLKAAVEHAKKHGAQIVEGYPVEPKKGHMPDAFAWTGLVSAFRKAGFEEVLRRSATRPIMRREA